MKEIKNVELEGVEQAILTMSGGLFELLLPCTTKLLNFHLGFTASDKHITGLCYPKE